MRRVLVGIAVVAMTVGTLGLTPAQATHCTPAEIQAVNCPNPVTVTSFEGVGYVCDTVANKPSYGGSLWWGPSGLNQAAPLKCSYHTDAFWGATDKSPPGFPADGPPCKTSGCTLSDFNTYSSLQGLYLPKFGPGAKSGFYISVDGLNPPKNYCVSSVDGPNCTAISQGVLTKGDVTNAGSYCGSSNGKGVAKFTSANGTLGTVYKFEWEQSAGSLLPTVGTVISTTPTGGEGATVIQIATSRGFVTGDNKLGCGVQVPVIGFQTEGLTITF